MFSWFSTMSSGPPISFSSSSTFGASNLIWSIDGLDIFVDCFGNDELFIGFSFVSEFLELHLLLNVILTCLIFL